MVFLNATYGLHFSNNYKFICPFQKTRPESNCTLMSCNAFNTDNLQVERMECGPQNHIVNNCTSKSTHTNNFVHIVQNYWCVFRLRINKLASTYLNLKNR